MVAILLHNNLLGVYEVDALIYVAVRVSPIRFGYPKIDYGLGIALTTQIVPGTDCINHQNIYNRRLLCGARG